MSAKRSLVTMFAVRPKSVLLSDKCIAIYATAGVPHRKDGTKAAVSQKPYWKPVILEAEKIIGQSSPFLDQSWLRSNEIVGLKQHLKKFECSSHPFLKRANGKNKTETYLGLIVILISKAAGHLNVDNPEKDETGVLRSQVALAKVTEMIRNSYLIHKNLVNIQNSANSESYELSEIIFGNKCALLAGDYFIANSVGVLYNIKNHDLSELMSSTIRDFSEAEFMGRRDSQNNPLPSIPPVDRTGYAIKEWTLRNELTVGSLLGKSCKGTLKLAKHDKEMQEQGYNFGKHLALAWEVSRDLNPFISKDRVNPFNLCSAPVMFHIESDPSILTEIDKGLESVSNVDYAKVYDMVISGPGIELAKQLQREHSQRASEALNVFHDSEARTALLNIIAATENCSK